MAAFLPAAPLGVGCWSWGDRRTWGYGDRFGRADLAAATEVLLEAGIGLFDTAEVYARGESERLLGEVLAGAGRPASVSTKFFPYPWRVTDRQFSAALRRSLDRLRRPRVELYQIHHDAPWPLLRRWLDLLVRARQEGLVAAIGTSNLPVGRLRQAVAYLADRGERVAAHQAAYNLCDRRAEGSGLLDYCLRAGIVPLAHTPLAQGLLTGSYTSRTPPPGPRGRRRRLAALEQMEPVVGLLQRYGRELGTSPAGVALAWVRAHGAVPLVGVRTAAQARDVVTAAPLRLTRTQSGRLDRVTRPWVRA